MATRSRPASVTLYLREQRLQNLETLASGLNGFAFRAYPGQDQPSLAPRLRRLYRRQMLVPGEVKRRAQDRDWRLVEELINDTLSQSLFHPLPETVVVRFNDFARTVPAISLIGHRALNPPIEGPLPWMTDVPAVVVPDRAMSGPIGRAVTIYRVWASERGPLVKLLEEFFLAPERDRLKRCTRCQRWFVDRTRNKSMQRCGAACTWRWWNRARRRGARHKQYKDQGKSRRRRNNRSGKI